MLHPDTLPLDAPVGLISTNQGVDRPVFPKDNFGGALVLESLLQAGGDADSSAPTAPTFDSGTGAYLWATHDDWYYRIHINPNVMDLGNIPGDQQREMRLWNAFLVPVTVTVEELVGGIGITYTSTYPLPGEIPPLGIVDYDFLISASGPPIIRADMTWVIDGVTYIVPFDGRRATLLAFDPNWSTNFKETFEWKTVIDKSYSGIEQSSSPRRTPRVINEYMVREHKDAARLFDLLTFGWQGRMFVSPAWAKRGKLAVDVSAGSTVITLANIAYRGFLEDQTILIRKDEFNYEIVQIDGIVGNLITLTGELAHDWPAGTRVYPCMTGRLDNAMSTTRQLPDHVDSLIRFYASPTDSLIDLPEIAAPMTYLGDELYLKETNWRNGLSIDIEASAKLIDEGTGPFQLYREAPAPGVTRDFSWMVKSRAEAWDLLGFFVRRRGRFKPLWIPSGTEDLVVTLPSTMAELELRVRTNDYGSLVAMNPARRHVVILLRDGTHLERRIEAVSQEPGYTSMTLDSPFGVAIDPANVKRVSFLGWYRLGSDSITFDWKTDEVAEVNSTFVLKVPRE